MVFVMNNSILFYEKAQTVYFAVAKSANTSVREYLLKQYGEKPRYITKQDFHALPKDNLSSFSIVRNPFYRIASLWRDKIALGDGGCTDRILNMHSNLSFGMAFEAFCEALCDISDNDAEGHLKSQYEILRGDDGKLLPKFVHDIDNFTLSIKLPKLNVTNHNKTDYNKYYTDKAKNAILKRYHKDFENFYKNELKGNKC